MTVEQKPAPHPAKFSRPILDRIEADLKGFRIKGRLIDPFAGVGGIHTIEVEGLETIGIEIEQEWAAQHPQTIVGDATKLPFAYGTFQAAATSCCYGNRMSDHHDAKDGSKRLTYRHSLGRSLSDDNAGQLQWGAKYRTFHRAAWLETQRVLEPAGVFLLNVSNHIRGGVEMPVMEWHLTTLIELGFMIRRVEPVETRRLRFGANRNARVENEYIITAVKR